MPGALDRQIEAYHRHRPHMLEQNQQGWALVARETVIRVFEEFGDAALYADEHYPDEDVLIRNLAEHRGMVPFIVTKE